MKENIKREIRVLCNLFDLLTHSVYLWSGFLNVGDDEIVEDDEEDDFMPAAEGTHLENSGWSSRTRYVYAISSRSSAFSALY